MRSIRRLRPLRPAKRISRQAGVLAFTLFELLVVLAIVAILAGLTAPALSIFKATSLSTEGSRLASLADLARQNSISHNTTSALIMSSTPTSDERNRAFAVFELTPRNDGSQPTSADWTQLTKWEILQSGVIADTITLPNQSTQPPVPFPSLQFNGSAVSSYQYALFTSTGAMPSTNPMAIRLVEGVWPAAAAGPTYTHVSTGGTPVNYFQIYFLPPTGLHKIERP